MVYKHGEDPWRFINGILYISHIFIAGMLGSPLVPVANSVREFYDKDDLEVNSSTVVYSTMFFVLGYPSIVIVNKLGTVWSVKITMILVAIGAVIRCLVNVEFYLVHVGQVVSSLMVTCLYII